MGLAFEWGLDVPPDGFADVSECWFRGSVSASSEYAVEPLVTGVNALEFKLRDVESEALGDGGDQDMYGVGVGVEAAAR